MDAALAAAEAGVAEAELRVSRTRTAGGAERRRRERARHAAEAKRVRGARDRTAAVLDEQRMRVVELDRERTRLERELRARHESSERARLRGQAKRDAERDAAVRELRTIEIELDAVAPDAIALLGGFDSWRQAPDKWLVEPAVTSAQQRLSAALALRAAGDLEAVLGVGDVALGARAVDGAVLAAGLASASRRCASSRSLRAWSALIDVDGDGALDEHRGAVVLDLEVARAGGEREPLVVERAHPRLAGLELGDQRDVARQDAELAGLAGDDDHARVLDVDRAPRA